MPILCIAFVLQALISALGNQWEKAIEVFREQEEAARHDPECVPNTITYSVRPPSEFYHSNP